MKSGVGVETQRLATLALKSFVGRHLTHAAVPTAPVASMESYMDPFGRSSKSIATDARTQIDVDPARRPSITTFQRRAGV